MSEECFITSDKDKAYIENVGKDFLLVRDIETDEQVKLEIEESFAEGFREEFNTGETIYILYDKETKTLI